MKENYYIIFALVLSFIICFIIDAQNKRNKIKIELQKQLDQIFRDNRIKKVSRIGAYEYLTKNNPDVDESLIFKFVNEVWEDLR